MDTSLLAVLAQRGDLANKTTALNVGSAASVVLLLALATIGTVAYLRSRARSDREKETHRLSLIVAGVLAFQGVHTLEHLLQTGYWILHPKNNPWLTPWADAATRGLTTVSDQTGRLQSGTELLHLMGNSIFLLGLVCMFIALRDAGLRGRQMWGATTALWFQGIHVAEHVVLTATWFSFGKAYGVSVLFGYAYQLPPPWAPAIRIFWHFAFNFAPMVFALVALREMFRAHVFSAGEITSA